MLLLEKKRGVEHFCSFLWNLQSTILVDMHESYNFFFNLPYNYTLCTYPLDRGQRTIEDPFLQILVKFLILFFENSCYYRSKKRRRRTTHAISPLHYFALPSFLEIQPQTQGFHRSYMVAKKGSLALHSSLLFLLYSS